MSKKYVVAFDSTHGAIAARKLFSESAEVRTIPVPRSISAACGIAIAFGEEKLQEVMEKLKTLDIEGEYSLHEI